MIRTLTLCSALILAPMAACTTIPQSPFEQTLADEKALYAAEMAYKGAAMTAEAAHDSGALSGERAVQVADALQRAYDALIIARAAYAAGNAFSGSTASAQALGAVAEAYGVMNR